MAKFKAYEKYAYSDYFKAELPVEWMEKRLSYISAYDRNSFVDGPFGSDLKSSDYKESGVPLIQLNNIRDGKHVLQNYKFITEKKRVELSRHVALPNDIVIAKMAEPVARSAIVSDKYPEYVIVADCVKLSPDLSLINLNFLNWAINSDLVKMNAELVSSGTTRIRISLGELKKLKIPYPSLIEQQAIANFLDHETAQIDTLIEKQQTLIQLLKEKRQAVISHAVTKGLNPDAPMKDSGVEWLGEVPEHWDLTRIKYITSVFEQGWSPQCDSRPAEENEYGVLKVGCVNHGKFNVKENKALPPELSPKLQYLIYKNDLLISRANTKELVGSAAVVDDDYDNILLCDKLYRLRFIPEINPRLVSFYLSIGAVREQIELQASGASHSMQNISQDVIKEMPCFFLSKEESKSILAFIDKQTEVFDSLINNAQKAIELMQERRTALISAAVTGKIDVRDWVAPDIEVGT